MRFILNSKEFELDLFDVNVAENFDRAFLEFSEKATAEGKKEYKSLSEGMKIGCDIIFDFFDNAFGKGTAENIFDGKRNYKLCLNTYKECSEQYNKFIEEFPKELKPILSPSTAQKNKQNYQNYINARGKKRQKNKSQKPKSENKQKKALIELEKFKKVLESPSEDVLEATLQFIKELKERIESEECQNE